MNEKSETPPNQPILLREDKDGIAALTLNRPDKYNALSTELMALIQQELDSLARDKSIHALVIAGNGKAFCAGHDLKQMSARRDQDIYGRLFAQCSRMMLSLTRLPQPVVISTTPKVVGLSGNRIAAGSAG